MATCIGIDLGGTFIKFGLLDDRRQRSETLQLPTLADEGGEGIVRQMIEGVRRVMADAALSAEDVVGIGIGAPGPLDLAEGVVIAMPNIPGMENMSLRDAVGDGVGIAAVLENDANAAAMGEFLCGAGREASDMVLLTLGTGVGGGVILDGRVMHGSHGIGAELGHMIIEPDGELCGCGQRGCLERYCSATYTARHAEARIQQGASSSLADLLKANGELTTKDINEARRAGDALAGEVWDRAARYLALACVNICRVFDPDEIVLAGGLIKAGDDLMGPIQEHFGRLNWSLTKPQTTIAFATLGHDAGVVGAAGVAWRTLAPDALA
ncbi:MAG: ROK family protein [Planctomycetota bacterium]|jgi:glucokinase